MTLEEAIEEIKQNYAYAVTCDWIRNPLAYSIYKVWERADRKAKRRKKQNERDFI